MSQQEITLAFLLQASEADLQAYKRYIGKLLLVPLIYSHVFDTTLLELPSEVANIPFFSASNRREWVNLDKFADFLREGRDPEQKTRSFPSFAWIHSS